jgi:hypothetical protein
MATDDMLWMTPEEIFDITRKEVEEDNIAVGQEIVAIFAGVDPELEMHPDLTDLSSANWSKLRRALAWQAVWCAAHPDVLEAMDVQGVSQDGLSATYSTESAHLLAPLAARCIRRLSWKLAPLRARVRSGRRALDLGNRDSAERDDQFTWTPMNAAGRNPLAERSGMVWR